MLKHRLFGFVSFILAGIFLFSCQTRHPASLPVPGIESDPALIQGVLPNGFRYLIMKNATPKERVNVHLNIFAGSLHETDEQQGVAHFLEHMLFNGSQHFKPGELIRYFQSIGMDFGADANASTSFFNTVYDLTLPQGDKAFLEDAFRVIQDYAGGALLLEEEILRERGIILAEKRERDSVSYRTFQKELAFELPGSRLIRRFPIGIDPVLETADQKLLKNYYDHWYRPDNMALVVVGDMDVSETEALIKTQFSGLKPRTPFNGGVPDISWKSRKKNSAFYLYEPEAGATEVTLERITREPFEPQTIEKLKENALTDLADAIVQNRLSRMITSQKSSFSSASAYSAIFLHHVSIAALKATCQPENWKKTVSQLEKTLRQALEYGFLTEEVDRVKADFISALDRDVAGADTRSTHSLARSILGAVNRKELFLSPLQRHQLLKPYLQEITLDQVNQAFRDVWSDAPRMVLVTGNAVIPQAQTAPEQQILDLYQASLDEPILAFEGGEQKQLPSIPPLESRVRILKKTENAEDLAIIQIDFENNIRLNLKQTPHKKGEFLFKVVFGEGRASAPETLFGMSALVESAIQKSGFHSMDPEQIQEALAGKEASLEFTIEETYFALSGSATPQEAQTVFQLIYAQMKEPGFRAKGLTLAKTHYRQLYEAFKQTPDGIMQIEGERFLAKGDLRFGLFPPDKLETLSLDAIENWLKPVFKSSALELSIVGDFDPDLMSDLAQRYLTALGRRETPRMTDRSAMPVNFPQGEKLELTLDTKIDKGMVSVCFLTDDFWDIDQTRKLSLLARFFSERLRKTIREELGASYSPYAYNDPSLGHEGYGIFHVNVNVLPQESDRVYRHIETLVRELGEEGLGEDELNLVKIPFLNHLKVLRQTNGYWLNSVLADSFRHPERVAWARNMESGFSAITGEDLSDLARRFLKMEGSALILIQPRL